MNLNGNSEERKAGMWVFLLLLILAIVIGFMGFNVVVGNLSQYIWEQNGDLVAPNGTIYKFDDTLYSAYVSGEVCSEQLMGVVNGDLGIRVYSLRGYKAEEVLLIRGLMIQEVVSIEYQNR